MIFPVAIGIDPDSDDLNACVMAKSVSLADADSTTGCIATLLLCLCVTSALVKAGHVYMAMPPLYRIDLGKGVALRPR